MSEQKIVYQQTSWSLDDLMPPEKAGNIDTAFQNLQQEVDAFAEETRPELSAQIDNARFLQIIQRLESINRQAYHLYGFASLSFAADTQDQAAQTRIAQVQQFMAGLQNKILFFELWWKQLDDANAERLMGGAGDYRYWLDEMRHFK